VTIGATQIPEQNSTVSPFQIPLNVISPAVCIIKVGGLLVIKTSINPFRTEFGLQIIPLELMVEIYFSNY
jgi:hypothetical protein